VPCRIQCLSHHRLNICSKESPGKKDQMLALNKSCHADIAICVFVDTSSVQASLPTHLGAEVFYAGEYRFMEWRQESVLHRLVMQRRQEPHIKRKYVHEIPLQADLSLGLFQGIACPHCSCALPARIWAGWSCPNCSRFIAAPPVRAQQHRYFAKANISYSGPRMDNGKAVLDINTGAKRHLSIWNDGIKVRIYRVRIIRLAYRDCRSLPTTCSRRI
jgi:hypothetical protein